ncbi:MAG: gliding motility protein GldB [Prevotella sp.]|nr:gliding motility protein GldB [Prevotella sp.]
MKKVYGILLCMMVFCVGCEWQLKPNTVDVESEEITIDRYDRIESQYLSTGDLAALQQMNTAYPKQTRMLIEDMLLIGKVDDPDINTKFLHFFQDSTLQKMLTHVQEQYADIEDINDELSEAFNRLKEELPNMEIPHVYTQVGSFDQSVIVGDHSLGISLDKYLGTDYPFYLENYTEDQRRMMVREMIVPDCLSFYILSLYPLPGDEEHIQQSRNLHMGRIQWVVNHVMKRKIFKNEYVDSAERVMHQHKEMTINQLLSTKNLQ